VTVDLVIMLIDCVTCRLTDTDHWRCAV